jgi:hypothetical protein
VIDRSGVKRRTWRRRDQGSQIRTRLSGIPPVRLAHDSPEDRTAMSADPDGPTTWHGS